MCHHRTRCTEECHARAVQTYLGSQLLSLTIEEHPIDTTDLVLIPIEFLKGQLTELVPISDPTSALNHLKP